MIPKPIFDASTAAFGISFVMAVWSLRALAKAVAESDLPLVGSSS